MDIPKKLLCLGLGLCLTAGCALSSPASSSPSSVRPEEDAGAITVSGIVTAVNGNEVTLDLVTMEEDFASGEAFPETAGDVSGAGLPSQDGENSGQAPQGAPSGTASGREGPSGAEREQSASGAQLSPDQADAPDPGEQAMPPGGMGGGYQRTGESAIYQIPVGAPVTTMTGAVKEFNSLSIDTLITITLEEREDGALRPVSVRVIQSV